MDRPSPIRHDLRSIHGLRGLAAAAVVVAHSVEHGGFGGWVALFAGRFGVEVFFVISGIVILFAAGPTTFSPRAFAVRRFFRVVPLYWLTTLLVAALAFALPSIFKSTAFENSYFWKSMFFIPDLVPGRETDWRPLFKLGWTLNYEVFFYLLVASLFWCRSINQRASILLSMIAALVLVSFLIEKRATAFSFYANLNLLPFAFGVIIAWGIMKSENFLAVLQRARWQGVAAAAILTGFAMTFEWQDYRALGGHMAMSVAAAFVALAVLAFEKSSTRSVGALWNWLGNVSYSIYLLHMFAVGIVWAALRHLGIHETVTAPVLAVVIVFIISAIGGSLSFKLFEKPLNAIGRDLSRKWQTREAPKVALPSQ